MPRSYVVIQGDTLSVISARMYGDSTLYPKILYANQQIKSSVPLQAGQSLIIPDLDENENALVSGETEKDLVTFEIDGVNFTDFTEINIQLSIDVIADSFSLNVPFEPDVEIYRNTFKPFKFQKARIFVGKELILTGNVVNIEPSIDVESNNLKIEGYSTPGILSDCTYPPNAYPLSFSDVTLNEILRQTVGFFNLDLIDNVNDEYSYTNIDVTPGEKVSDFIIDLAQKRACLLYSTLDGKLAVSKSSKESAKFTLKQGDPNIINIKPNFNGQIAYTTITGLLGLSDVILDADSYTEEDKFMSSAGVSRPYVFNISDVDTGTLSDVVKSKLRRNWSERVSFTVTVEGWRNPLGEIWKDNTRILIHYPSALIYNPFEFLIKTVRLKKSSDEYTAELDLVFPQSFDIDEELESLPWE